MNFMFNFCFLSALLVAVVCAWCGGFFFTYSDDVNSQTETVRAVATLSLCQYR